MKFASMVNTNVNRKRGAYVFNNDQDSGPSGILNLSNINQDEIIETKCDKQSREQLSRHCSPLQETMCSNTYSATKPPVQAVSELSMPQQSEYETVSLAKNLFPIDNSSRELCANVNKSFVETVRTGDWKTESLNDEWIKVQRRKHRNRPVDADRVRGASLAD
ncbi:hypothetical protein ACJJTC_002331 [Scirpophaga incertulas]